jgi:hypothetical protein
MRLNYDTSAVAPDTGRTLWAPDRYPVEITGCDVKPTKAGDGEYIEVEFSTYEGRRYVHRYNVANPNQDAERIGRSQFSALHHAAGVPALTDTDQLIGRKVVLDMGIKKNKAGEDENTIRGYIPANGATSAPKPQHTKPGAASAPPWASGKAA